MVEIIDVDHWGGDGQWEVVRVVGCGVWRVVTGCGLREAGSSDKQKQTCRKGDREKEREREREREGGRERVGLELV